MAELKTWLERMDTRERAGVLVLAALTGGVALFAAGVQIGRVAGAL